ncbi:hypothetical protein N5U00_10620 [Aliarcobacter butzleri]|uniref:hypothetical protein n=1 Tax=Aliarcobacter butzleri TaxID=28197 RepID=UPI0021B47470|nr:hypothetical protein [Aliarcobacter butzleri]MCT7570404.1 hypothetical protein [Aliarcobacter butzleri]MCT7572852.1 hypothetical protein [Aliarcobacter butzleri]MCT7575783.1 hypothetical protein [Aliarcobacter butzleri]MCT7579847.1 hypothetical protein [Aliarcobacter butzleri]
MRILGKKVKKILNKNFLEIKDEELKKLFELDMPYPYNMKFGQLINMETQIVLISMTLKNTDSQKELIKSIERIDELAKELTIDEEIFNLFIEFIMNEKFKLIEQFSIENINVA